MVVLFVLPAIAFLPSPPTPLPRDEVLERMKEYKKALGVTCTYCHAEDDMEVWTRNKLVAQYMQKEFVNKLTLHDKNTKGKVKLTCNYCHQGKAKIIDRTPPPAGQGGNGPGGATGPNANKMWNTMQMFTKGLSVSCTYCHTSTDWTGDNGRKKTARTMLKNFCQNLAGPNDKTMTCLDCHKGKPLFLPTEKDIPQKKK